MEPTRWNWPAIPPNILRARLNPIAFGRLVMNVSRVLCFLVVSAILCFWVLGQGSQAITESTGAREPYVCASRSDIVGQCFELRGRLSFWNGAPSARIWPVGTKRLLGVHFDVLPPALEAEMTTFDPSRSFNTEVWADFMLCPFTRYQKGHMQFVCIERWGNAAFRHRKE